MRNKKEEIEITYGDLDGLIKLINDRRIKKEQADEITFPDITLSDIRLVVEHYLLK